MKSRHLVANNVTGSSLLSTYLKNQMMVFGGTNKNITASLLKQALNMTICFSFNISPATTEFKRNGAYVFVLSRNAFLHRSNAASCGNQYIQTLS
ncbi:MAG: hypothetical protein WBF33_33795 [Candidatus Nitrosopolaris sp.]